MGDRKPIEVVNTKDGHTFVLRFYNDKAGRLEAKSAILNWYRNAFLRERVGFNEYAVDAWYDTMDALEWDADPNWLLKDRFTFPQQQGGDS